MWILTVYSGEKVQMYEFTKKAEAVQNMSAIQATKILTEIVD